MTKRLLSGIAYTLVAVAAMCFTSCSDDEEPAKTPIALPQVAVTNATHNSLTFEWAPVSGAVQYGYKVYDALDEIVAGGVTEKTSVSISDLNYLSSYTIQVWAYPTIEDDTATASDKAELTVTTPFYTALNFAGTHTSGVISQTYSATIVETRQQPDRFGTFAIKGFYGVEGYDLEFTVNSDNTITVTNGTIDEASGWKKVATGSTNARVKNGLLIDDSRSSFSRTDFTVTFYAKGTRGSNEGYDTFVWEEE